MASSVLPLLFSWTVVGVVSVLVLGVGFGVMSMSPPAFLMAKMCFTAAAIIFMARVGFWLASTSAPTFERLVLTLLICGIGGTCWVELLRWVDGREPKPEGSIRVIFSDSPLLTEYRKAIIAHEFGGFREYLIDLGFDLPETTPPVQINPHGGLIGGPSDYDYTIMLRPEYLDDVIAIRSAYAEYTFIHMLKAPAYDLLEHPNRFPSADVFAVYFVSSYSNKDYSRRDGWNEVLWKTRLGLNQKFMDHAMFFGSEII
jgi:hypothetical protein